VIAVLSAATHVIDDAATLQALAHPTRVAILEALREPGSAASVARAIGQPRQLVNHHVKHLEAARLVERVGERRKGNFVEVLYRAVAGSFVVAPEASWASPRRAQALQSQHALGTLVDLGGRLQRDAAALLDRAAFEGENIPAAAVTAEARFASPEARAAFMDAYLRALRELLEQHASDEGEPFRAVLAVYPAEPGEGDR
jgi:DNA-binding transcriptional ArsR family regulator